MAITVVQTPNPTSVAYTAGVKTYTGLTALTIGDYVVACAMNAVDETFSSVALGGQAMTAFPNNPLNGTFQDMGLWYRRVTGAESGQDVVITLSGGDANPTWAGAVVIRGLASTQPTIAGGSEASASSTSHDIAITPGSADNIIIAFTQRGARTWTDNGGWTDIGTPPDTAGAFVYDITSSASARTYSYSNPDSPSDATLAIGSLDAEATAGNPWHAYAQQQHPGVQ